MALGSLNVRVSKEDFENRITIIETRMAALVDVINRYGEAKQNLDQFIESDDKNYDEMIDRIDENIMAAKKAHAGLNETKLSLQDTVNKMENLGNEIKETITSGTEATRSAINAAIKIESIL